MFWPQLGQTKQLPYEKNIWKILSHPGVPGDPPQNDQNPLYSGGCSGTPGWPKILKYFLHTAIL